MTKERLYCTFFLGDHFLGVEAVKVQEVIRYQEMTPVPLSPPEVTGLINLRGQIVTAIDLARRLELDGERPEGKTPMNVVVHCGDGAVSLLVDEIGDVIDVGEYAFERPPETLKGTARELIRGAYKLPGRLLLALDVEKVVDIKVQV
jgi:purine-binding chemotaxis protein CheW